MSGRNAGAVLLGAALLSVSLVFDLSQGSDAVAQTAPAPAASQIAAQVSQALAALKNGATYRNATRAGKALLLAQAVRNVVASALENGVSASTISTALNTEVASGVVSGAIAVEGSALAAVQVAQSGGPGASQASGLVVAVQSQQAVSANISANGSAVAVTVTNSSGTNVTVLTPLSSVLTAAAGNTLTANGQVTGTTTTTPTAAFNPCAGVSADYC